MANATETWTAPSSTHTRTHEPGLECGTYGQRLRIQVADELARKTPECIYATVTSSPSDIERGFRDVTIAQFANAVNYAAWDIRRLFGVSNKFDVIAYIGVSDIRYAVYLYASIKTGHQLMIPSVRNSESQHLSVFKAAQCTRVLHTAMFKPVIARIKEQRPELQSFPVPHLDQLIEVRCARYEYNKKWADARTDPIVIAHSSGSTGNPKPTTITHGVYSTYDNHRKVPQIAGRKIQGYTLLEFPGGGKFYNPFPPFHLAGLFAMTIMPIFYNCTVTIGPPEKPPSGELLSQVINILKIRAACCPPTVIEQFLEQPGGFEQAASLDRIMYTGGPLAQSVGDRLSKVTDVCQMYGSTETGPDITLVPLPKNWQWFEWHPLLENAMDSIDDGTFETVVYKDTSLDLIRHLSQAYPHVDVWRTNDLFVKHPNNPRLWKFHGRRDDVLVLSNGEKFNPVNMEGVIVGYPLIRGALIVGKGRFQASLIIEPRPELKMSKDDFIQEIWPVVEKANVLGPAHGRIFRDKVEVASADKPFLRAGKGTVIRGLTTKLYTNEINALYAEEEMLQQQQLSPVEDVTIVTNFVRSRAFSDQFIDTDDLFVLVMDSLQTLELTKSLNRAFALHLGEQSVGPISNSSIHNHSTVRQLGSYLHRILNGLKQQQSSKTYERTTLMNGLIFKYLSGLQSRDRKHPAPLHDGGLCVAIIGSTGSLSQHLLQALVQDSHISKIYCLNRTEDARSRQIATFQARGFHIDLDSRVTFLTTDFNDPLFGLSFSDYDSLLRSLDVIIHNSWKVNFNHKLTSFEDVHIRGVRHLIDFCLASSSNTRIFFFSLLSSVGNWPAVHGVGTPVPEFVVKECDVAMKMGYGESKHVAERILQIAAEDAGVKATVLRVGQLTGPLAEDGVWNRAEWFPNLVETSKALGLVSGTMITIDWISVDSMAKIISELTISGTHRETSLEVFNLTNLQVAEWYDLTLALQEEWGAESMKVVPWKEWLDALSREENVEEFPALRVLDFYRGLAAEAEVPAENHIKYVVERAIGRSYTMVGLEPINKEVMTTWLKQWAF